uniref:Uncharacterized protein n=1 Tax=Solanum lycopersicum TaxID=4081 RepID=A0A494GAC2_SOLLC
MPCPNRSFRIRKCGRYKSVNTIKNGNNNSSLLSFSGETYRDGKRPYFFGRH